MKGFQLASVSFYARTGDTLRVNKIPFVISYKGGDGNDVTLTATNRSLSLVSSRVEAGNGNGVIDANECDHLFVALMNETGNPLAVSHVVLDSATPAAARTANPDAVRLHWSTAYPEFDLQCAPNLNGAAPYPFANVPFMPFVVDGDYSVTNKTTAPQSYYRLRKP